MAVCSNCETRVFQELSVGFASHLLQLQRNLYFLDSIFGVWVLQFVIIMKLDCEGFLYLVHFTIGSLRLSHCWVSSAAKE